jgi:5'-nucleotidase
MNILLTNDDGVHAPGILALQDELAKYARVITVAPDREKSAASHQISIHTPVRINEIDNDIYALDGTPVDCVKFSLGGFINEKIDLVVSGINNGPNMGMDVIYSGTVAAAREALIKNVPSIAFSIGGFFNTKQFKSAAINCGIITDFFLNHDIIKDIFINVNVPNISHEDIKGIKITSLGHRNYHEKIIKTQDPYGKKFYWLGGDIPDHNNIEGSDLTVVEQGYISITPLHLDTTAFSKIENLKLSGLEKII